MSVPLVVLRLEVDDNSLSPKSFFYQAPEYIMSSDKEVGVEGFGPDDVPTESQNLDKYRGQRDMHKITVETLLNEGPLPADDSEVQETAKETKLLYTEVVNSRSETDQSTVKTEDTDQSTVKTGETDTSCQSSSDYRHSQSRGSSVEVKFSEETHSRSSGSKRHSSHSPQPKSAGTIYFFSGNPMVEITKGILHVYKDNQLTSVSEDVPRSEMVCILSVPAAYTIHDVLQFTAAFHNGVEFMRIIRDSSPNQYMLLIKFRNQENADEFYTSCNNTPFNSIEDYMCHLVYVAKVEAMKAGEGACLPVPGLTELPSCPVCLERMDECIDGILTILCNHSFHVSCLSQWGDTSCPVCRYSQTPEEVADNRCLECGSQESLWICLVCGHVGCGRYVHRHAYRHFQETHHTYAMQVGNNRVWDYAGDNYVHRLVQNKADGKLVEVDEGGNYVQEEKLTSLTLEYTYLLTNQLESQRLYFEEKMTSIEKDAQDEVQEMESRFKETKKHSEILELKVDELNKEKHLAEKKCTQLHSRLTAVLTDLQDEREMNKGLLENQQAWQKRVTALETQVKDLSTTKDQEIQDLKEQLRDVMFYLEAQQKLSTTNEVSQSEIQEGQIIVGASSAERGKKGRKKGR